MEKRHCTLLDIYFIVHDDVRINTTNSYKRERGRHQVKRETTVTGLEPAIPRSEVWCLIH